MFEIGSYVMYGNHGVCTVEEIRTEDFSGEKKQYYILSPKDENGMTIYVPLDAPTLTAQMRPLLTREEIGTVVAAVAQREDEVWISDRKERAEYFSRILREGDCARMLEMLRLIYRQRCLYATLGKKMYQADENAFAKAERLLFGEFSVVLGIGPSEVVDYVRTQLLQQSEGA